ncbi:hypothetical protein [Streptomyces sp. NRRL F-5126]|uniref:hypothetical protein n=1 Tax=Streptomyces sp. NRRL F-5126 TaxID=1463857 RepID=UPI000A47D6CD|nr:hypothetical protein [Streptomyces sp. NRRL F-5126]
MAVYASAPDPHLDTVEVGSPTGAVFFDSPTHPADFRTRLDLAARVALTREEASD